MQKKEKAAHKKLSLDELMVMACDHGEKLELKICLQSWIMPYFILKKKEDKVKAHIGEVQILWSLN